MASPNLETIYYEALNGLLTPLAESGALAPGIVPAGLIVLETTGWRSGRARRTPVVAAALGDCLLVSTVRGRRSHWVKNLLRNGDVRYRSGPSTEGLRPARATVFAPDEEQFNFDDVPPYLLPLAANLACLAPLSGCAFVLLRRTTEGLRPMAKAGD